jgi:predicted TIM-barrel fold metal-dependent hydrolase
MPIVDCHVTLEGNLVPTVSQNASQLADLLAVRGIERAIVTSARAARVDPLSGNHLLKSLIEPHPGLFACLTMHVNRVDASIQAARELLGGRRFVSVMLTSTDPSVPLHPLVADEVLNACRRYQKPIFIPTPNAACVETALHLAKTYTMHKFILLGMGGSDWRTAIAAAQQAANISLEMSGSLDRAKVPAAIEALGSHRLLFGSGLPALDPVAALGLLDDGDVRPNDRRRILVDNAEKVFGLPALTI